MKFMQTFMLFALLIGTSSFLFSQAIDEYTIKAIWLEKFTHFIQWPVKKDVSLNNFIIGVYNKDPFQGKLELIYSDYFVNNRKIIIKHIANIDSINQAEILFISANNDKYLPQIAQIAKENSVLLIGDSKGYSEQGVHINFFTNENQIRFEINESAMQDSEFFVSFRLLNIAKIVQPIANE